MRDQFQAPLRQMSESRDCEAALTQWMGQISMGDGAAFMAYWYVSLYVVIEGWQTLDLTDPVIDALIASEHTNQLRLHRNATCHFQKTLVVDKWERFYREPGTVDWVRSLDQEFRRYLVQRTKAYARELLTGDLPPQVRDLTEQFLRNVQANPGKDPQ